MLRPKVGNGKILLVFSIGLTTVDPAARMTGLTVEGPFILAGDAESDVTVPKDRVAACRHSSRVDSLSGQSNGKNATVPKNSAVTSALFTRIGTCTK